MPDRPIELVVPYVQGGGSDQRARLVARHLESHLGERIDVVNRTGAIVGHTAIAAAPADGRTIGLITGEIGMMHWHEGLTELTWRDYTPLAVPFVESAAVIVAAEAPWRTLARVPRRVPDAPDPRLGRPELQRLEVRARGTPRRGRVRPRASRLDRDAERRAGAGERARRRRRRRADHPDRRARPAPRRAGARAGHDGGRPPSALPRGPYRPGSDRRRLAVAHWRGLVAPPRLPDAIRVRYVDALLRVAADASFEAEAAASAFTVRWRSGDEFARYMEQDDRQFGRVIALLPPEASCMH